MLSSHILLDVHRLLFPSIVPCITSLDTLRWRDTCPFYDSFRFFSLCFGFSHQESPQRIFLSSCFYLLCPPPSLQPQPCPLSPHPSTFFLAFPVSSLLATPSLSIPIYFLRTILCPYHLSLVSRVFCPNRPNCAVPLMYSFLILSILLTPNENRNIFNSVRSISASCLFVIATVSNA